MKHSRSFLVLAAGLSLFAFPRTGGAGGGVAGAFPRAAAAPVDRDSIAAAISWLAVDPSTGEPRTRFAPREAAIREVADTLAARLSRYTGNPAQRIAFPFVYADSSFTAENIVARIEGTGAVSGAFILSAHFDATAVRTTGWRENWRTWPAPGANDNATGAAALLEAARVLGAGSEAPPFDVLFALFSAEELDLLGSADFVRRIDEAYDGRIIGVINLDMLGWPREGVRGITVLANPISGWLSDLIVAHIAAAGPALAVEAFDSGVISSDHVSFLDAGIPAILVMEPLDDGHVAYPYYHSLLDTPDRIDVEQTARIADAAAGFLDGLGAAPAEIAMLPSDIILTRRGRPTTRRAFSVGDTIGIWARARNTGSSDPPSGSSVRMDLSLRTGGDSRALIGSDAPAPAALDEAGFVVSVVLGPEDAGENVVRAAIRVTGMDNEDGNDEASLRFAVEGAGGGAVLRHAVQPNPVRGGLAAGAFCMNLARPVDVYIELLNVEGERVGSAYAGERWGRPLVAGLNCLPLGSLFPGVETLVSGVYLYRLVVYDGSSQSKLGGRFAAVR
ncbi:MAG: Zn-dependent exopeptidase M28 [Candidatus Latescibacterota bacterium]|nr:MAG: Zn-dependent exopeptidase M28 [Candidatus Latescibacterota bacterium]